MSAPGDLGPHDEGIQIDREALIEAFVAESADILASMEQQLLALEAHPGDEETLHSLFRAAHTVKGSSAIVAFDAVRDLAHHLESVLERLRARSLVASNAVVSLLLRGVDLLRTAIDASRAGGSPGPDLEAYHEELRRAASGAQAGVVAESPANAAAATLPGVPVTTGARTARTLRVDVAKLDRMINLSGEIAIARGRLGDMLERGHHVGTDDVLQAHREADRLYLDLQDLIMQARMVPVGPTFQQQARTVRDIAATQQKQIRLVLEGEDVEVDTSVVEQMRDPLMHMVRNAVDHGIEAPPVREQRGKDPCGTLTLRAFHEGAQVVIELADDGAGLDRDRILRRAVERGLVAEGASPSNEEIFNLVFEPGFSTAERVTDLSGRGVGMDVVRRNVEALRGTIAIASEPCRGTTITLRFPLTLAIIQGFRVAVAGEVFILPLDAVAECIELPREERRDRTGVLNLRGKPLPYVRLRTHFDFGGPAATRENVVVVQYRGNRIGLVVDALLGESQTVIKPLGRMFQGIRGISGSAILGDGRVALIVDVPGLMREVLATCRSTELKSNAA